MDILNDSLDLIENALSTAGVTTEDTNDTNDKVEKAAEQIGMTVVKQNKEAEQHKVFYDLSDADRDLAVYEGLIPKAFRNSKFSSDAIKDNLKAMWKKDSTFRIHRFKEYESICNGILSALRMKQLPTRSYIIGAPNGFGKTSFVSECLMILRHYNFLAAPYISLTELATIRKDDEEKLMRPFYKNTVIDSKSGSSTTYYEPNTVKGYMKTPKIVTGLYSFSEYINADCLFVSLSGVISKDIESEMLHQLLNIRGAKGLPTIVMMSTSLEPYLNDSKYGDTIWNEIITHTEKEYCYDRVTHISCYKNRELSKLANKGSVIEDDTGIVS